MGTATELFMAMRSLFRLYDKMLKKVCTEHDLTIVEADVISFLQNNPEKDTAADIVELRRLPGSCIKSSRIFDTEISSGEDSGYRRQKKDPSELKPQVGPVTESIDEVRAEFVNTILEGLQKRNWKCMQVSGTGCSTI